MPGPDFLDLPARTAKPRRTGITHVLDAGIPLRQAADLLDMCGTYVDVWKLGWGVAYLDPNLDAKLELRAARCWRSPGRRAGPRSSSAGPNARASPAWRYPPEPCRWMPPLRRA